LLLPLLLLGAGLCFWTLFASVSLGEAQSFIPAPLGSNAVANYGEDDIPGRLRSLSISIVEAVIRDRDPEEGNVGSRVDDVIESLKSPVPTVPGAATGTPTRTPTNTPDPLVTPTETLTPSPSPFPSRTPTPTKTDAPTAGPSPTPSKTPSPTPCKVPPHIEILAPTPDRHYNLSQELPAQAFAFDPDNVDPINCDPGVAVFPTDDGVGLPGDPEVTFKIEWDEFGDRSSWVQVHEQDQNAEPYCAFTGGCDAWDLISGLWPDSTPINTGRHRVKAMVLQDDEGDPSGWHVHEFYIDPSIITVENVSESEGSGLTFDVTLDYGVPGPFTVDVSLTDVTATGDSPLVAYPDDYDNVVATLNFSGSTGETQSFTVDTLDDDVLEGTEAFTVSLSSSSSYVVDADTATGTITDNDSAAVTVDNVTVTEGAGLTFSVTLNNAVASPFDVNVTLTDVTATGGTVPPNDYDNTVSALNFSGAAAETLLFTVDTFDDTAVEGNETFTVSLIATDPLVNDSGTATGTITDNDVAACPDFALSNFNDDDDQKLWWRLTNTSVSVSATIVRIDLSWTNGGKLQKIRLEGDDIWNTEADPPFVSINSGWKSPSRTLIPLEFKELRFEFQSAVTGDYTVTVYSDDCTSVAVTDSPD
jgi:hypothetical protein